MCAWVGFAGGGGWGSGGGLGGVQDDLLPPLRLVGPTEPYQATLVPPLYDRVLTLQGLRLHARTRTRKCGSLCALQNQLSTPRV